MRFTYLARTPLKSLICTGACVIKRASKTDSATNNRGTSQYMIIHYPVFPQSQPNNHHDWVAALWCLSRAMIYEYKYIIANPFTWSDAWITKYNPCTIFVERHILKGFMIVWLLRWQVWKSVWTTIDFNLDFPHFPGPCSNDQPHQLQHVTNWCHHVVVPGLIYRDQFTSVRKSHAVMTAWPHCSSPTWRIRHAPDSQVCYDRKIT